MSAIEVRTRADLRADQNTIVDIIRTKDAVLIVLGMGSGKTGATLTALRDLLDHGEVVRVIVIAPLRVAKDTWPDEIVAWAHTRRLSCAVCVGTEKQRLAALAADASITIVNREVLPWLWEWTGRGARWRWDTAIVDESSMFKDGRRRTAKAKRKRKDGTVVASAGGKITRFGVLAAARAKIDRIVLLTGTPGELIDLWGQVFLIDGGERLGRTKDAFTQRWFKVNEYAHTVTPLPHAEREIMDRVADVMVSFPPKQLVDPPVFVPIRVDLPPAAMAEYRRFQRTLVSEQYDVEAVSAGVLTNKLLQFANGSLYQEDGTAVAVHDAKLAALDELVERAAGEPLLVFYGFQFDLAAIRARHPHAVVLNESDTAVADWNAGRIKMLLAHPASCAHGLNLQYGGHLAVWFGLTWSLELYLQANARLPRPGQKHQVAIYQIIAKGTVDEKMLDVLDAKGASQDAIIRAVQLDLGFDVPQGAIRDSR